MEMWRVSWVRPGMICVVPGISARLDPTSLDEVHHDRDGGDDEEDVDHATHRVGREKPEGPQYDEDDPDGHEHDEVFLAPRKGVVGVLTPGRLRIPRSAHAGSFDPLHDPARFEGRLEVDLIDEGERRRRGR